ncbi:MAG: helicase-related protein, partial [Bacteroidota bacterium]
LREGIFDVLIGINLLREGLDLPEVSLVAILDADKEGFLRNSKSLIQTTGRAARNVNGKVIMYADKVTDSMRFTIDETARRRKKQIEYNTFHNITPTQAGRKLLQPSSIVEVKLDGKKVKAYVGNDEFSIAADPVTKYMSKDEIKKQIARVRNLMLRAAKELNFIEAARYRDELFSLEKMLD